MAVRAMGLFLGVVLSACSTLSSKPIAQMPITGESEHFPDVEIMCKGDASLSEDDCRNWAGQMLLAAPTRPSGGVDVPVVKLVLTYRTGASRCAADYFGADGRLVMTIAAKCPSS